MDVEDAFKEEVARLQGGYGREGCPFLGSGAEIRGHEFHYSEMTPSPGTARAYMIKRRRWFQGAGGLAAYRNTLASYVHLHFASNPEFPSGFRGGCVV